MITIYKNTVQQKKLAVLSEFARMSWINVICPDQGEKETICELLKITPDILEDSLDEYELPRVKLQDSNLVIILRAVFNDGETCKTTPFTIILNDSHITTISTREINFVNDFITEKVEIFTTQQSNFFIKVCHRILEYYQANITTINRNVQTKKRNLHNINKQDVLKLVESEEQLNHIVASLTPTINVIKKTLNYNYINLYRNDKELISDLLVDGEQVLELCNTALRTIRNIRDGYTTVMTISLNQIIEILTYITAIFTLPMIMASIYGMNIALPLGDHPDAFWILAMITAVLIGLAVGLFIWIRKKI